MWDFMMVSVCVSHHHISHEYSSVVRQILPYEILPHALYFAKHRAEIDFSHEFGCSVRGGVLLMPWIRVF